MSFSGRLSSAGSQSLAFPRRELFQKVAAATLPFVVPRKPSLVSPLENRPVPEFWFGDRVSFCWNDEDTEIPHSETGEIIGAVWNPRENCWEYAVTWLSSTDYPSDHYPIFDGNFVTAEEICKL